MSLYSIEIKNPKKSIVSNHLSMGGTNPAGDSLSINNYYLEYNHKPFFAICGEFHFSRCDERLWENEIIKMKMGGINIVSTYIFWIFHEEEAGNFNWTGNKNLKRFVEICSEQGLYVIIRIGPFCHGEIRNGGLPDWLFGRTFEVRSNDEEYLAYVRRFYHEIGRQVAGLMFQNGGPIIGVQIENEYMHAGAPWEITTGVSQEWLPAGRDGNDHIKKLKQLAVEAGMNPPFFTATAWGGAAVLETEMLPLWGGYAFWPWIFYGEVKEHPATPEFIFRDYHNNQIPKCYNFEPVYPPENLPYACCEMGGGMTVFYRYRFQLPPQSVSAMSLMKTAGGCNFVGYYMYHGGTNPKGQRIPFLNEHATPKISYDFQAAIGEFGQLREHYHRLRLLHYFYRDFAESFCPMKTVLPRDTTEMDPNDTETLRYAVRANGNSGYLFLNNYQDHLEMKEKQGLTVQLKLNAETVLLPQKGGMTLKKDVSCILPFNLDLNGVNLKYATTQLITKTEDQGITYFFFFMPEGMKAEYCFDNLNILDCQADNGRIEEGECQIIVYAAADQLSQIRITTTTGNQFIICTLTEAQALKLWKTELWGRERLLMTDSAVLVPNGGGEVRLEVAGQSQVVMSVFPEIARELVVSGGKVTTRKTNGIFTEYTIELPMREIELQMRKVKDNKLIINFDRDTFVGLKELLLKVDYCGDVGYAFIDGELIHDNFSNGAPWVIGLKSNRDKLLEKGMYIYISPLKQGAYVKSDSAMAARTEVSEAEIAEIRTVRVIPVYEVVLI